MMNKLFILALSATSALAADGRSLFLKRAIVPESCSSENMKDCGSGCIDLDWTCCPSGAGGCPPTEYCVLGSNGQYGCCPNGEVCGGTGGASTQEQTNTIVSTISQPGTTSTLTFTGEVSATTEILESTTTSEVPPPESTSTLEIPPTTVTSTFETTISQQSVTLVTTPVYNGTAPNSTAPTTSAPKKTATGTSPGTTAAATSSLVPASGGALNNGMSGVLLAGVVALLI